VEERTFISYGFIGVFVIEVTHYNNAFMLMAQQVILDNVFKMTSFHMAMSVKEYIQNIAITEFNYIDVIVCV